MKTQEIRECFLRYFEDHSHCRVESSSLIPKQDPTLLFVNAGMVPFKQVFLGNERRDYTRATSSQRCVRAGGKHNDLDNVGFTARHHTFFEMLGNFSFGDYFKKKAIALAWNFLTQELGIPSEKLWVTVFEEDQEAEDIWLKEIGVNPERLSRIGAKDNFWAMGDTGPCGPCTEIFYDHGSHIPGGPPGTPDEDGDRYIEIWNLVFMQYNRDKSGQLTPLPQPCVDTGMGLERIAAVMQGVHDNYDIDLFQDLIQVVARISNTQDKHNRSLRVIADHIRSSVFLILDGVVPSNEGRGYVLRRIMRRALRHGYKLGIEGSFFDQLVAPLCELMGQAYPDLIASESWIKETILTEEKQFARTLTHGVKVFELAVDNMTGNRLSGDIVFKLYDTYGFPVDLTQDMASERDILVDHKGFEACMAQQRNRARSASRFEGDYNQRLDVSGSTQFDGYTCVEEDVKVVGLWCDGQSVETLHAGDRGVVVLNQTPFYGESGGQIGDSGELFCEQVLFSVSDTQKQDDVTLHIGDLKSGKLSVGLVLRAKIHAENRDAIKRNHSATHLLHAALRDILGEHVMQKGSHVGSDRLRFDFSHGQSVSPQDLRKIELKVNAQIRANHLVEVMEMSPQEAKKMGAMALFGEKYGDQVRVLKMGAFSIELCGGTHVTRTGDIGLFKLISEAGVASGVRRIEALSGSGALQAIHELEDTLSEIAESIKAVPTNLVEKVKHISSHNKSLQKRITSLESELAAHSSENLCQQIQVINGVNVLVAKLECEPKQLRDRCDGLKKSMGSGVVVLASTQGSRISLVVGVTDDLTGLYHAGNIVKQIAEQVGGKGGGRADMAQAGGSDVSKLDESLENVKTLF